MRLLDRATRLALVAAHLALEDAGIQEAHGGSEGGARAAPGRAGTAPGIVMGTSFGSLSSITGFIRERRANGPGGLNPSLFPNTVINSPASQVAIRFGLRTICTTVTAGWASGLAAIGYGMEALERGRADVVLVGGCEELAPENLKVYGDLGLLAPDGPCRPGSGRGTVLGEGACFLVLERAEAASARGARVFAHLTGKGSGFSLDGGPGGLMRAIAQAGGLHGSDLVVRGANGVLELDQAEAAALEEFVGLGISPKARLGETDGAGGALAAALAVLACSGREWPGYDGPVGSAVVLAPSYSGHAAALRVESWGES